MVNLIHVYIFKDFFHSNMNFYFGVLRVCRLKIQVGSIEESVTTTNVCTCNLVTAYSARTCHCHVI